MIVLVVDRAGHRRREVRHFKTLAGARRWVRELLGTAPVVVGYGVLTVQGTAIYVTGAPADQVLP